MGAAGYIGRLRRCVGHDLLLIPSAAACIRDEEGRLLLLRRSDEEDLWGFPGGAMELGEGITQTVVREVREETGLEVKPVALIGVYSSPEYRFAYPNGDQVQVVVTFFECRVMGANYGRTWRRSSEHATLAARISCRVCAPAALPRRTTLLRLRARRSIVEVRIEPKRGSTMGGTRAR